MPRRKTTPVEDVSLHEDEILVTVERDDPPLDEAGEDDLGPLVEGAPVSAAARHNARYADA